MMKFVRIEEADVEEVYSIYKSCKEQHAEQGFFQWDSTYPTLNTVIQDVKNKHLFGLENDRKIVAVVAINNEEPEEYNSLDWYASTSYVIVHRLCVGKENLRKGIAKKLMLEVERYVGLKKYEAIRLDTFSLNKVALNFYQKMNYRQVGKVCFSKRTDSNYTCFEKIIRPI